MADERPSNWRCWGLVAGLAAAHFVVVLTVDFFIAPQLFVPMSPRHQPPWLHYAFVGVFLFPASVIFYATRPGPDDGVLGISISILTCLLWGCVWAEPFRRKYGWQPWHFSIQDLLILTTAAAAILGLLVLLD
jgi:hypothetical protein